MAKKDKKATSVINALKLLNNFSQAEIEEFEILLKNPKQRNKLLQELRIPIKKGLLIKSVKLNKVLYDLNKILSCNDIKVLSEMEQQISLEIRKDNLIKKINEKKIPISKQIIEKLILSTNINELDEMIKSLPTNVKLELGKLKFRDSEPKFVSVIPIYTPMGNKR